MNGKTLFVVNPAAGSSAAARKWWGAEKQLSRVLSGYSVEFTKAKGDAVSITRRALRNGAENVVAVGGDGTLNEVLNGFFENGHLLSPDSALGVIPMGTGSDWVRSFDQPWATEALAEQIRRRARQKCDIGKLSCRNLRGQATTHFFINVADAGFGGELARRVNNSSKTFGPFLSYFLWLLSTLSAYKKKRLCVTVDDHFEEETRAFAAVVANGQFFGGGMWVAPQATLTDGLFEVVIIGDVSRMSVLLNIGKLYKGTLAEHPKVISLRGKRVVLESEETVWLEADGEVPGQLPASFEVLPQAINIIANRGNSKGNAIAGKCSEGG